MTAQTAAQRTAAHRKRQVERMSRYEQALREIVRINGGADWNGTRTVALEALEAKENGHDRRTNDGS